MLQVIIVLLFIVDVVVQLGAHLSKTTDEVSFVAADMSSQRFEEFLELFFGHCFRISILSVRSCFGRMNLLLRH